MCSVFCVKLLSTTLQTKQRKLAWGILVMCDAHHWKCDTALHKEAERPAIMHKKNHGALRNAGITHVSINRYFSLYLCFAFFIAGMSQYGSTQVTQYTRGNATHNGVSRKRATLAYEEARNWSPMNNPLLSDGEQTVGAINDDVRPDRPSSSSAVDEVVRRRQSQQREALSSNSCKSVSSSREMSPVAIAPKQQIYMRQAKMDNTVSAATSLESLSVAPETFPPPPPSRDGFGDLESLVLSEQGHELERMENDFQQMLHTWSARRRELMRRHQQERTNVRQRQQQQQESESR